MTKNMFQNLIKIEYENSCCYDICPDHVIKGLNLRGKSNKISILKNLEKLNTS